MALPGIVIGVLGIVGYRRHRTESPPSRPAVLTLPRAEWLIFAVLATAGISLGAMIVHAVISWGTDLSDSLGGRAAPGRASPSYHSCHREAIVVLFYR